MDWEEWEGVEELGFNIKDHLHCDSSTFISAAKRIVHLSNGTVQRDIFICNACKIDVRHHKFMFCHVTNETTWRLVHIMISRCCYK